MARMGWHWHLKLLLCAVSLCTLSGCFGLTQNPNYFPFLTLDGDIIRTHAKPPGLGYFSDYDPHAVRLEVRPVETTNPVRAQQVLIATIYDEKNNPRRHRRIEWMIEGVGNIIEVDESGYAPGRGYKVDNKYAVSYTDNFEHRITRGTADPNDDFVIRPGQSWCVVSAAVEGDTHVTVYAPEIHDWNCHKVFVTTHWVDAEWVLPTPTTTRMGTQQNFTTNVFRHTDRQPLAKYRVRYRLLDGPPAVFLPSRSTEEVAASDLSGHANVALVQTTPQPGINHIGIEIIRPPDPTAPSGAGIVIGRGETTTEWLGPQVSMSVTGPASATISQDMPYTIAVTNTGKVETQAMTVRSAMPEGLQYVRSQPPANVEGNQLTWTLGALPGGQASTVQAVFRAPRVGAVTLCANVTTVEGLKADGCANSQITAPQLSVAMTGPPTGVVNVPATFQITLTNPGTGPATNVVLTDSFDAGLEHSSRANPVEMAVGTIGPGETKNYPLALTPRQVGRFTNRIAAAADGNLRAQAEAVVTVQTAKVQVSMTGPGLRYVDRPADFTITVVNTSEVPLTNVIVRDQLPPELAFNSASDGGQSTNGQVVWNLGTIAPREQKAIQLSTRCLRMSQRTVNVATLTAEPGLSERAEAALEIRGLPAFGLELKKQGDPAEIGGRLVYQVNVNNTGTLAGDKVEIVATLPKEVKLLNATGPSQYRQDGLKLIFAPVDNLQPKQTFTYTIEVEARQAGDVRFQVELRSAMLKDPVTKEESTTIYDASSPPKPITPAPAAPAPPPAAPATPAPPPAAPAPR